jgi:L-alanine-DL-glutamate epimerase-like enolase superfamily enzyme
MGKRPRPAGCNARLGAHGDTIRVPVARLTTNDGVSGFGVCWANQESASQLLNQPLAEVFSFSEGVPEKWRKWEFALWDLIGRQSQQPVWKLACQVNGKATPQRLNVPCYDTSLYFDDLHLKDDIEAAALMAAEACEGFERGYRHFKIKVGRGAMHMDLEAGTRRDIAVIKAVRQAIGGQGRIMIDANNGYNLNLARRVLDETADCGVFWLEEAFHEDASFYRALKNWLNERDLKTLIADGEGDASPHLLRWADEGLVDVIQYDIGGYGFSNWLHLGKQLDAAKVRSAPHHYGGHFGNYAAGHLAGAIENFTFVEWDECATPGLDGSAYVVSGGEVVLPNAPGWGVQLDQEHFRRAVRENGFELTN